MTRDSYDVVVVGGGAAGLSGALMLGRSRRDVLVIDGGEPRNAPAAHMHGFFTRDGTPPSEMLALGRAEVERYGVELLAGTVVDAKPEGDGFRVELTDGTAVQARRLLVTTGLVDELPDLPGLREGWGTTVVHCPYCHGWEVRDEPIGVLFSTPHAVHVALLFRQLSDDVVFFPHTTPLGDDERALLAGAGVEVVDGNVTAFDDDGVHLDGDRTVPRAALAVGSRAAARAGMLTSLGVAVDEHPSGAGSYVPSDPGGLTSVPGVWVAGNVADPSATVIMAAAAGAKAGAMINADLALTDARAAAPRAGGPRY